MDEPKDQHHADDCHDSDRDNHVVESDQTSPQARNVVDDFLEFVEAHKSRAQGAIANPWNEEECSCSKHHKDGAYHCKDYR